VFLVFILVLKESYKPLNKIPSSSNITLHLTATSVHNLHLPNLNLD